MKLTSETAKLQEKFAAYCRTGVKTDLPGINHKNISHYRRLVYNVVRNTLEMAYPITRKVCQENVWNDMVSEFFSNHPCQTPQVWQMPYEFYQYAKNNDYRIRFKMPFLIDLLYFEWIEIEVHTMPDLPVPSFSLNGSEKTDIPVTNPEFRIIRLEYPVHLFSISQVEQKRGDYFLLVFREPDTGKVEFISLSALYAYIIELLSKGTYKIPAIIQEVNKLSVNGNLKDLGINIYNFVAELKRKKFILGYKAFVHQTPDTNEKNQIDRD